MLKGRQSYIIVSKEISNELVAAEQEKKKAFKEMKGNDKDV